MRKIISYAILGLFTLLLACERDEGDSRVVIPDFNYPQTVVFNPSLSSYGIFTGNPASLVPDSSFQLLELNASLFSDYSSKQRLVSIPEGSEISKQADGSLSFPDGSILVKTFYYWYDARDTSLGKRIIESRLLIKERNTWNAASYLWDSTQTEAYLRLDGHDLPVSWVNATGQNRSTMYHVPNENECIACHQSNDKMSPLGPKLRNLNRQVERNGSSLNQIQHLQNLGLLSNFDLSEVNEIIDYNDPSQSLSSRGRSYLEMNCAHCHNPSGWDPAARQDLDFRYGTPFTQSGINAGKDRISELIRSGEMPFIGTTLRHEEGLSLMMNYLNSL